MDAMFSNPFGSFINDLVNHGCQLQGGIAGAFGKSRATRIWFALRDGNRFKNMFVSSNSCCSFGDIPYKLQGGMCIDQMQQYIAQGGNTKTGYAKNIAQPNLNFNTMLNNGSYVSKQRGRRTRKQNDTKQIALMFGGWHLPFSPCHQFSKMWDHEGLRLQDLRLFSICGQGLWPSFLWNHTAWPERKLEGGHYTIKRAKIWWWWWWWWMMAGELEMMNKTCMMMLWILLQWFDAYMIRWFVAADDDDDVIAEVDQISLTIYIYI